LTTLSQPALSLPQLRAELDGEVIGPRDEGYDAARAVYPQTIDRPPAAIVRPIHVGDIATVVSVARETGALAVRSGAHSLAGHGVADRGIGGAYVNFVGDEGAKRVRDAYPGRTWARLAAIKREYDPENLFRLNQNNPPERE
jgi:FAD/FMN-containing dehydrogenase